jgi:preprotein translocase subunit SecA
MSDDPDDYDDSDFDDSDLEDYDLEDDEGEGNTGYYNYNTEPYIAPYKPGRNDPCVCGSGKKYKKCCMNKPEN